MDLTTEITQIRTALTNCTKAEEYYYWMLALNEARKAHTEAVEGEPYELLSPVNATNATTGIIGSSTKDNWNSDGAWILFSSNANTRAVMNNGGWWALDFQTTMGYKAMIYRYTITTNYSYREPDDWVLEVSDDFVNTETGEGNWYAVDQRVNSHIGADYSSRSFDVVTPKAGRWVRMRIPGAIVRESSNEAWTGLKRLAFYGKRI